jgi:hypothetical protein
MRSRRALVAVVALFLVATAVIFLLVRRAGAVEVGLPIAQCPGPDAYGYTCEVGADFAYIDATTDTFLYSDDGIFTLELPFSFTYYGADYSAVNISTNGNLQFGGDNTAYSNVCLNEAPSPEMGDMMAPYWTDLDLTFVGFIEYDIVGESPERVVVIEWDDAPRYGTTDDTVTFEIQLFEGSNDFVFLYQDAQTFQENSGSGATIGIQSEAQGFALQMSCDQPAVTNGAVIHFPHPGGDGADEQARPALPTTSGVTERPIGPAKGEVAELLAALERDGRAALPQLRQRWLGQSPVRRSVWQWADVTGDGQDDLVMLWHGEADRPDLARLALVDGAAGLLFDARLSSREEGFGWLELASLTDLTGDGAADALVRDPIAGRLLVASAESGRWQLYPVPEKCTGSLAVREAVGGPSQIVRDGCAQPGRLVTAWDGAEFVNR